ncbi:hypothetical protein HJC23_003967 [Cyclotella cryptica]|uniref:Uncharacterized protein n=1 Tax=Cyclotella cryptica TaxID=29204 RepID=A0ABD3QZZ2_9STRA|eukprot:CCRYP_001925-RA/>CCRYP_001925-RA protein AED:0.42 eAED:0.42 QI:146/1/1/1/1/1/3/115/635
MPHLGPSSPLQKSALITRKQLGCLTGGKIDTVQHKNILGVGTPINCYGGPAIGIKNGVVHHMCLKENRNHPIPNSSNEDFLVYKEPENRSVDHKLNVLKQIHHHPPIPIFWEPVSQDTRSTTIGNNAKGVAYIGHWRVNRVEDLSNNPVTIKGKQRIALICLRFHYYSQIWSNIIDFCHDKTCHEIKIIDFQHLLRDESFNNTSEESSNSAAAFPEADILGHDGQICDRNFNSCENGNEEEMQGGPIQPLKFEVRPTVGVGETAGNPMVIDSDDDYDGPKKNCTFGNELPSLKDLEEVVDAVVNAGDRNAIKVKDVCESVAKHFGLTKISRQTQLLIIERATHVLKQLIDNNGIKQHAQGIQPKKINNADRNTPKNGIAGALLEPSIVTCHGKKRSTCLEASSMVNDKEPKKYRREKIGFVEEDSTQQQKEEDQDRQRHVVATQARTRVTGPEVNDGTTADSAIVIDGDDINNVADKMIKTEQPTFGSSESDGKQITNTKIEAFPNTKQDFIGTTNQHTHHITKTSSTEATSCRFHYFKVDVVGLDMTVGGIVIPADKAVTFRDLRHDIMTHQQLVLPFSSFCFDLGNDFVIQPSQEALEVKDHVIANGKQDGSLKNPFRIFIRESSQKNDIIDV